MMAVMPLLIVLMHRQKMYIPIVKAKMKTLSRLMLLVAIASIMYGYRGAFTRSGDKVYDEMDAYLPFFVLIFGAVLLIAFVILTIIMRHKKKKIQQKESSVIF